MPSAGRRPTFLVIGAYKAGTTSIHHYLKQHPQVFMSRIKEIRFLAYAGHQQVPLSAVQKAALQWPVRSLADYEALFDQAANHQARGDVSPCYLAYAKQSIVGIKTYVPQAKLIVVLRHPADRAYSSYTYIVNLGREAELDFRRAVHRELDNGGPRTDGRQHHYLAENLYFDFLRQYFQQFPREQIQVHLYDDLIRDGSGLMKNIFRFIGVDDTFTPNTSKQLNTAAWSRVPFTPPVTRKVEHMALRLIQRLPDPLGERLAKGFMRLIWTRPPPLDPAIRHQLTQIFREDILKVQDLIGRDLSSWLKG